MKLLDIIFQKEITFLKRLFTKIEQLEKRKEIKRHADILVETEMYDFEKYQKIIKENL